jgi:UDP-N-acetylmuramoyl-L-alanyl-D-glutamate--2,6-diaminopimelate ligase
MRDAGVDAVVMEVSSHALALHRADGMRFDVVAFTNLSQDHLDFHFDMESYYLEKRKLFTVDRADKAVVNVSDEAGVRMQREIDVRTTTVALDTPADLVAHIVDQREGFTRFEIETPDGTVRCAMPLPGWFNVVNALVAVGICRELDVDASAVVDGLASLRPVHGRMELVDKDSEVSVIVDYAHTPAAVETVVSAGRDMTNGRIIAVVGAGGDRDAEKRPIMGAAAATHADVTIVTTDNPRSEDPAVIAAAVEAGARGASHSEVHVVLDRREAIAQAVRMANAGDLVLILGKGHEVGQEVAGVKLPFDDVAVASEALAGRGATP